MKLLRSSHAVYKTQYHIVWVTKYRRKILNKGMSEYFSLVLKDIKKYYGDIQFIEIDTDNDHIHIHIVIPPKYSVATIIQKLKTNTSSKIKAKYDFLKSVYWGTEGIWSPGYFVSTAGINEEVIKKYVEMQGKEDKGQAELEL